MHHGILDVFAFQEALLIEAAFGVALLTMMGIGFRRWLRHKEEMGRLIATQTAELAALHDSLVARVEARLNAIEQNATRGGTAAQTETGAPPPLARDDRLTPES